MCACACGSYVGDIVVSVNPFKNVGCVGKAIRNRYKKGGAQNAQLLMPHCYHLVDQTYAQVRGWPLSLSPLAAPSLDAHTRGIRAMLR